MGTVTKTGTASVYASSHDTSHYSWGSVSSSYPITNAYDESSSTTYARINWKTGSSAETYVYLRFDLSDIPANATIDSISCSAKAYVNTTSSSRVTTRQMQMATGTTLKGSALTISTSTSSQSFSNVGTWTRSELDNAGVRFYVKRGSSNTTSSYQLRVYGASITVDYTYQETTYTITVSGENATPSGDTEVLQGESFTVKAEYDERPKVTDNGVDVSNQLVQAQDSPEGYSVAQASGVSYGFELNGSGYYESQNRGVNNSCAMCVVSFHMPVSGTVTFSVINYAEDGYDYGLLGEIDGTLSTNASGDASGYYWSGKNNNLEYDQRVTYQMPAGDHEIYVKFFKDQYEGYGNDSLQFKVSIELDETPIYNTYWAYTIDDVQGTHVIVVSEAVKFVIYQKINGVWTELAATVWKKTTGWSEQDDPGSTVTAGDYELKNV